MSTTEKQKVQQAGPTMDKCLEILEEIESISDTKYYTEFKEGFTKIKKLAEENDLSEQQKLAQYDIDICSLCLTRNISGSDNHRFCAYYSDGNGNEWPNIASFTPEQYRYYEQRLLATNNIFLRARYADFLFEHGVGKIEMNRYQLSIHLQDAFSELTEYYYKKSAEYEFVTSLGRLNEIALRMNNEQKIQVCVNFVQKRLLEWDRRCTNFWTIEISKIVRNILHSHKKSEMINEKVRELVIEVLEDARKFLWEEKEYHLYQKFCEELIEYKKVRLINSEKKNELLLAIGLAYEEEAVYQQGRDESLIVKAHYYEKAMNYYAKIGEKKKIDEMKVLIKETYKALENSDELKPINVSVPIPNDYIKETVECYKILGVESSLERLSILNEFIPKIEDIDHQVEQQSLEFPFFNMVSRAILNDGRKVDHTLTEEDSKRISFSQNYTIAVKLRVQIGLKPIIDTLIAEYKLDTKDIMQRLRSSDLLDDKNLMIVEKGIIEFFEQDFVSSLHILVPQFESTLRRLFSNAGYATTSRKKETVQHEETFNEFLSRQDIREALGEDIHKLIEIVMVEQSGLNLRNNVAHGLMGLSEFDENTNILVIYLFLILTRYHVSEQISIN